MVRGNGTPLKDKILQQARQVLEEEGVGALSTRRLAKAVGCTATALYLYFDNKEALLHVLMEEGFAKLGAQLEGPSRIAESLSKVHGLARAYVNFGLANPAWYELMFQLPPERLGGDYPADKYRAGRRHLERLSEALAEAGLAADPRAALAAATLLWSSLHGLVALLNAGRIDASLDQDQLIAAALQRAVPPSAPTSSAPAAIPATGSPD